MFCPNCGAQNPETAAVCGSCQQALQPAAAAPVPGRPAPRFKGTMLMMTQDKPGAVPGVPSDPFGPPMRPSAPTEPPGNFPRTVAGGMPAFDPSAGDGMDDDMMESKTVMQPQDSFGHGAPRPMPMAPPPAAPPPPVAPPPRAEPDIAPAHTIALDGSAFGLGGNGPGPAQGVPTSPNGSPFGPPQRPQQPVPPPAAAVQPEYEPPPGGTGNSTVALDASAFGVGFGGPPAGGAGTQAGGGQPSPFGPPRQASQGAQPSPFGPPQPQNTPFGAPQGGPPGGQFGPPPGSGGGGFGGELGGASGGVASTVALDASQFNLGGGPFGGPPAGPGASTQGGPPRGPQGYPQGPQPGGFPQQGGYPQQGQFGGGPFAPPQGMQGAPGMAPYSNLAAPPPAKAGGGVMKVVLIAFVGMFVLGCGLSMAWYFLLRGSH